MSLVRLECLKALALGGDDKGGGAQNAMDMVLDAMPVCRSWALELEASMFVVKAVMPRELS